MPKRPENFNEVHAAGVGHDLLAALVLAAVGGIALGQLASQPLAVLAQTLLVSGAMVACIWLALRRHCGFAGPVNAHDTVNVHNKCAAVLPTASANPVANPVACPAVGQAVGPAVGPAVGQAVGPGAGLGAANRVTLARGVVMAVFAGLVFHVQSLSAVALWLLVLLATVALLLDGLDGWLARRTGAVSAFGARFDMEVDACFILVLCALVLELGKAGPWVLLIGALRYVFVAASWWLPALNRALPDSLRRKTVCVVQGVVLVACLAPIIPPPLAGGMLLLALLLLVCSFAVDSLWLLRRPVSGE